MGLLGHLRGDGQRSTTSADDFTPSGEPHARRTTRSRTSRTPAAATASSSRCPLTATRRREADQERRAVRARGGRLRRQRRRALPHRGQLRLPVRVLQVRPAERRRRSSADSPTAARSTCSRSTASRKPTWRAVSPPGRPTPSNGSRSTSHGSTSVDRPAPTPSTNDEAHQLRRQPGPGAGCGQVLPARGRGLRPRSGSSSRSTQGGGAAMTSAHSDHGRRLRQGLRADLGLRPARLDAAHALRVAQPRRPRLPGQRHDEPARHARSSARTHDDRATSCAGSPARGACSTSPRTSRRRPGDEFAGATFSPDGATLYVNIQPTTGMLLRDLGTLGTHRRLIDTHGQRHGDGRRAVLAGRRRAKVGT